MPTLILNKKAFLSFVGKKLSDEQLRDRISMLGTSVEAVTKDEIAVEVFPNRPDFLSEQGLARALASFLSIKKGLRTYPVRKSGAKVVIDASVKRVRPYTACAIVKKLKLDDGKIRQMIQMQEKLHVTFGRNRKKVAIGVYPLERIVLPIRYTAKRPGEIKFRPLDARRVMAAHEILAEHPAGKEYGHLLQDASVYPVFLDREGKILSMPPIINSEETGRVTEETQEVFIECSGHDLATVEKCLNMIVTVFAEMGGVIYGMDLWYGKKKVVTPNLAPTQMKLEKAYVQERLGIVLSEAELKRCLERMGYAYKNKKVFVPAYRADVLHPIDLVEDVAIAYGYEHFKEEIPKVATIAAESKFEVFRRKVCEVLVGYGLLELHTYNVSSVQDVNRKMRTDLACVDLANALTEEYNVLRPWVLPSVLKVLAENTHHEYPQNVFTTGTVFKKEEKMDTGVREQTRLAVALCGKDADFTKGKQIFDGLCRALGVQYMLKETVHPSFIEGRVGRVGILGKDVAYLGEVHPEVLGNWKLEMPVVAFELNLSEIFEVLTQ